MIYKIVWSILFLGVPGTIFGATVIAGNGSVSGESFDFSLGALQYSQKSGGTFVSARFDNAVNPEEFAVSLCLRNATNFVGLAPEKVSLNNVDDQANPLYNTNVLQMALVGISPMVTPITEPASLYVIQNYDNPSVISMLGVTDIKDSAGAITKGIAALSSDNIATIVPDSVNTLIALVTPNGSAGTYGTYGAVGSGVATMLLQKVENSNPVRYSITLYDAQTGLVGNRACPLDITSSTLKLTNNLASLTSPIVYYDAGLGVFYAGFQATAGLGGTRGVVRITGSTKIQISEIAPVDAIEADSIIGTNTDNGTVTIYDVKTMTTSTNVSYLVVVGGTASGGNLQRKVFAMPLVSTINANIGILAKKDTAPVTQFSPDKPYLFLGRGFVTPAAAAGDLYTSSDVPAIVGGGAAPGDITALMTFNDAVMVAVQGNASSLGGIFISQAIFNTDGAIEKWTPWVRAAGATSDVFQQAYESLTGNFIYATGTSASTVKTVQRTVWTPNNIYQTALEQFFTKDEAGVQQLFNYANRAVSDGGSGTQISSLIATGYNQISLIQTAQLIGGILTPITDLGSPFASNNGTLTGLPSPVYQLVLSGGALESVGAIISAAIVQNEAQAWLFVGGIGGLAVLADDDGTGFDSTTGFGDGFSNLRSSMKFRKVGNYANIRKLLAIKKFGSLGNGSTIQDLYILTSNGLESATISSDTLAVGSEWISNTLATVSQVAGEYATFSDVAISTPLGLLATSKGLYRTGNSVDISFITTEEDAQWTSVSMPESPGPVTRFLPISPTVNSNNFGQAGNLYVLAGAVSTSQARLYRYVVDIQSSTVTNSTVQLFPDYYHAEFSDPTVGSSTFFTDFGNYRNYFSTNGAGFYVSRSAYLDAVPVTFIISEPVRTGVIGLGRNQNPILAIPAYRSMGQLVSNFATGGLCAYGDFGLQVNE